jgi:hypothetical protein
MIADFGDGDQHGWMHIGLLAGCQKDHVLCGTGFAKLILGFMRG